MMEFGQVTGATDQHETQSGSTATAMSMCLCSQRSLKLASPSALHGDGLEPQADVVLRPSALHLAERIFKKLVKLRKKALCFGFASCFPVEYPCREGAVTEVERRTQSLDSVDAERGCGYDSDEHSAGFVSVGTPTSSSSSFDSLGTSHGAPSTASASHKPGSQLMASMLLSLLTNDDFTVDKADDEADSGNESEEYTFGGPRESAWHQPEDEILTEQEWRMMRSGHQHGPSKPAMAAIVLTKHRTSCSTSCKHFIATAASSSKHASFISVHLPHPSSTAGSKRESSKHM